MLSCRQRKHDFYVSRRADAVAEPHDLDNTPFFCYSGLSGPQVAEWMEKIPGNEITINYEKVGTIHFSPNKYGRIIFKYLDGIRSLREIFDFVKRELHEDIPAQELLVDFKSLYEAFNSIDALLLRDRTTPPFPGWQPD